MLHLYYNEEMKGKENIGRGTLAVIRVRDDISGK